MRIGFLNNHKAQDGSKLCAHLFDLQLQLQLEKDAIILIQKQHRN